MNCCSHPASSPLNAISDFASYFLQAPSNPFSKSCKDLNDLIVGGKFKCAILITSYPRQIKSLCVKSSRCWITYKRSIYWINVRSNFILMWLTADFGLCKWDLKKHSDLSLHCNFTPNLSFPIMVFSKRRYQKRFGEEERVFFFSPFILILKSKERDRKHREEEGKKAWRSA